MSTLALEALPKSFASLVREGRPVRLTDKGKLVATVVPPAKRRAAAKKTMPKSTITEVLDACRPRRRPRPDRDFTAFLRAECDRE